MKLGDITERQIQLVQESFAAIAPRGEALAARFYERLFGDYPELRPMFKSAPQEQQKKLLAALTLVVQNLRKPEKLAPALEQLGKRHVDYGVEDEQYGAVGASLLLTLAEFAGDQWNEEVDFAWTVAYDLLSARMIESTAAPV
jgi:hemoglobin-like flavoprotein